MAKVSGGGCVRFCLHRQERIQVNCRLHDSALWNTPLTYNVTGKSTRGINDRTIFLAGSPSKRQQAGLAEVVSSSAYILSAQRPGKGSRSFCRVEAHVVVTNCRLYTREGIPAPGRRRAGWGNLDGVRVKLQHGLCVEDRWLVYDCKQFAHWRHSFVIVHTAPPLPPQT